MPRRKRLLSEIVAIFGNAMRGLLIVGYVKESREYPVVVGRSEYRVRSLGHERFEVFRERRRLGSFFGPDHKTPHRVVPIAGATVAELRELYAVVHAWRELFTPAGCVG